ncbi:hypothetical protein C8F01DRAFT_1256702 [Mycena amicta]|nr:hypothetical protein C8F01DRAFT_1256702 [Mycena amicta]
MALDLQERSSPSTSICGTTARQQGHHAMYCPEGCPDRIYNLLHLPRVSGQMLQAEDVPCQREMGGTTTRSVRCLGVGEGGQDGRRGAKSMIPSEDTGQCVLQFYADVWFSAREREKTWRGIVAGEKPPVRYDHRIADPENESPGPLAMRMDDSARSLWAGWRGHGSEDGGLEAFSGRHAWQERYPGQPTLLVWLSVAAIMAPTSIVIVIVDLAHRIVAGSAGPLQLACCWVSVG